MRWRVPPDSTLRWRHWPDEAGDFVVYHDQSGDTHRLNPLAARALEELTSSTLDAAALAARLAEAFPDAAPGDIPALAGTLLARFYDLGLVEPVGPVRHVEPVAGAGGATE